MRIDEKIVSWNLLAMEKTVRTVVERGDKSLLSDRGSENSLGREKEEKEINCEGSINTWDEARTKKQLLIL